MRSLYLLAMAFASIATANAAEEFNGSKPLACRPLQGHDCLPGQAACKPLEPRMKTATDFGIDFQKKTVWSPYRTTNATLPIQLVSKNRDSLVLQGTTLELVWSGTIHRETGRMTVVFADREGAYVVFGQCKVGNAAPSAK